MHEICIAYIDPGAGSIGLQLLIGSLVGVGLFLRGGIYGILHRIIGPRTTKQGCPKNDSGSHCELH